MTAANIAEFISLQASIERVTDLMDKVPQIQDSPEVVEKYGDAFHPKRENWEPIRGEIEFRDVTFRYPDGGDNVLEHFSLHIPQGATVAIVGETGAGKSTLVNLACRFFEPTEGRSSSTGWITGSAASCGSTATSAMCFRTPICSPAPSGRTSATASWTPPTRRWRPPPGPCPPTPWWKSWTRAGTAT
ncbi:MAG: ATP-binding cassette domain-containing protein [Oscillospiraceae bacterium]